MTEDKKQFASQFKPMIARQSDKYSWRLYQRIMKKGRERVYLMGWNTLEGRTTPSLDDLKSDYVAARGVAFGMEIRDGWFHGKTLSSICAPGESLHDWAYGPDFNTANWIDITDWFWREYKEYGRCRFFKDEHVYREINRNARRCVRCGKQERRIVKTKKSIERLEVWI